MEKNALRYSAKNLKYVKVAKGQDTRTPAEIILKELESANEGSELNHERIRNVVDEEFFDSVISYYQSDPNHAIDTYRGIVDEELGVETENFLEQSAQLNSETKLGDIPEKINPREGCPDYNELKKKWGESAEIAMDYVYEFEPNILDDIVFIGLTDDPDVAGVFEPELTDEIQGKDTGKRQGVAFRLSPIKIESEVKKISKDIEDPKDIEKIRQLVIAEIIVHEAAHANGANKEGVPLIEERDFLKKVLNKINKARIKNGKNPLPVDLK